MKNEVIMNGRLTRDPECKNLPNGNLVVKISLAVERRFRDASGNKVTDFFDWTAFGKTAEFIAKYWHKGDGVLVSGPAQNNNYTDKNGNKVYRTSFIINEAEFGVGASSKSSGQDTAPAAAATVDSSEFLAVPDGGDDGLPFN